MIKTNGYENKVSYEKLPLSMPQAIANSLMFSQAEIAEAWTNTYALDIRSWLTNNLELLISENLITLNKKYFETYLRRDIRLQEIFSTPYDVPGTAVSMYTFHVPIEINEAVSGGPQKSLPLYISTSESLNRYIVPLKRFRDGFKI